MRALRTAIVGAGMMGRWHARYAADLGAAIVAVIDRDPAAAHSLAGLHTGVRAFASLEESLQPSAVEAVHICTDAGSHAGLAEAALAAGCHVLVEKPAALNERDARRLVDAARRAGRVLVPAHQFPFQSGSQWLLRRLPSLGGPVRLEFTTCSAGGEGLPPNARRALMLEILPHPLSLFRSFTGGGTDPAAWCVLHRSDDALSLHAVREGTQLHIDISLRGRPTRNELAVLGSRATGRLDLFHGYGFIETGGATRADKLLGPFRRGLRQLRAAGSNLVRRALAREPAFPGLRELIARFHAATRGETAPPVGFEEILESALLIERLAAETEAKRAGER